MNDNEGTEAVIELENCGIVVVNNSFAEGYLESSFSIMESPRTRLLPCRTDHTIQAYIGLFRIRVTSSSEISAIIHVDHV